MAALGSLRAAITLATEGYVNDQASNQRVRNALTRLGEQTADVASRAETWAPWRSYALLHLWSSLPVLRPDRVLAPAAEPAALRLTRSTTKES